SVNDIEVSNKKVLVRVDFNVPLDAEQKINNDKRIKSALPTIKYLIDHHASVILLSHLGRPKGKVVPELSLEPVAKHLSKLLGENVIMMNDCIGKRVNEDIGRMKPGEIVLLENTRFHPEEKKNDPEFAKQLASLGDIFINDAFGTAHRAHASNVGLANILPSAIGFLVEKELKYLKQQLGDPQKPFTAIFGGVKVSGKIELIKEVMKKADNILIGGAMMFTFYKALGYSVGKSLVEEDKLELAKNLLELSKKKGVDIVLPVDTVIAKEPQKNAEFKTVSVEKIPNGWMGLDIGEKTIKKFKRIINESKTVVWNGPMGMFEIDNFAHGTYSVAQTLADFDGITIIGGGDSAAAVEKIGLENRMTHISTGGGASLEMLAGKELPGIAVIPERNG
ncbi:MAG: phosphoglycerate kinase, partial [Candidatus Cloacimonadota bacterium]|nr:phosphoglycerate kinase [Candidatus Cloacimonadota bacterium]